MQNKCNFTEYNISSKKSICMCEIKSKIYTISEILNSKETVSKDFKNRKYNYFFNYFKSNEML